MLRDAVPGDRERVLALWLRLVDHHRALSPGYPTMPGIAAMIAGEIRRAASSPSCRLIVAEREARLVGFLFAEVERGVGPNPESAPGWIHELYVEPGHRERGVAARLVAESDAFFASRGVTRISVRVESSNTEALAYWGRHGFAERARILERIS